MYDTPANVFVAGFIGSPAMNIGTFPVARRRRQARQRTHPAVQRSVIEPLTEDDKSHVTVGFRPESLDVVPAGTTGRSR